MAEGKLSAEEVARELSDSLRLTLAFLHGGDDELAQRIIGLCGVGSRLALRAYDVITLVTPHVRSSDEPDKVRLTDFGREVIDACHDGLSAEERSYLDNRFQALAEARERRRADEEGGGRITARRA